MDPYRTYRLRSMTWVQDRSIGQARVRISFRSLTNWSVPRCLPKVRSCQSLFDCATAKSPWNLLQAEVFLPISLHFRSLPGRSQRRTSPVTRSCRRASASSIPTPHLLHPTSSFPSVAPSLSFAAGITADEAVRIYTDVIGLVSLPTCFRKWIVTFG